MTKKHTVLLVDDEPEILFSLRGLLRTEFDLLTAGSGAEALEVLRRRPVDVIVTDQRMPGMTGTELLRRARADHPAAVRIVFTGYADTKAVVDAINEGAVYRYLTKPWDPDELAEVLREACVRHDRAVERGRLLHDLREHVAACQNVLRERGDEPAASRGEHLLERVDAELATPD